jgi:hypothetical protein
MITMGIEDIEEFKRRTKESMESFEKIMRRLRVPEEIKALHTSYELFYAEGDIMTARKCLNMQLELMVKSESELFAEREEVKRKIKEALDKLVSA